MGQNASPALVLVGSYAAPSEPGIYAFAFDEASGRLTSLGSFAGIANPSFLVVHPNGRWLYAVSETSQASDATPGAVWALQFEHALAPEPFSFEPLNQHASGGDSPCHLQLDVTGKWLFVSNYSSGSVSVLRIQPDGALGEVTDQVQHQGSGPNTERQESAHAHSTTLTPDNRFAIVADLGIDQLVLYEFDPEAGRLRAHSQVDTRPAAGPRHLAFHPSGRILYVANELDNTVAVYEYYEASGSLRERQVISTLPLDAPENTVADIHVLESGERVYVSNRGHNSVAVFEADTDGQLRQLSYGSCGGDWPRNFALAPGGRFMLVANQYSGDVTVLPLLIGTDEIGAPVTRVALPGASCVQFVRTHD